MLQNLMKYGGISGKIHALYGRRLTPEDFQKIRNMNSVAEIASFLRVHPGWSGALQAMPGGEIHRGELEKYLRIQVLDEYQRIFKFMGREDHELMSYPIIRAELDQLLLFLRHLRAGVPEEFVFSAPEFYLEHSNIDFEALKACTTYPQFLEVIRSAPYYAPMVALAASGKETPDYTDMEVVLRSYYYNKLIQVVDKKYHGQIGKLLQKSYGMQVDMLNLTRAVRIRRFFSQMGGGIGSYLIPVYYLLRPDFFQKLAECPDEESADKMLKACPYGKIFRERSFGYIEEYYYRQLEDFNRRELQSGTPNVYTPIAYLTLKEIELKKLISAIECVRYQLPSSEMPSALVGL